MAAQGRGRRHLWDGRARRDRLRFTRGRISFCTCTTIPAPLAIDAWFGIADVDARYEFHAIGGQGNDDQQYNTGEAKDSIDVCAKANNTLKLLRLAFVALHQKLEFDLLEKINPRSAAALWLGENAEKERLG